MFTLNTSKGRVELVYTETSARTAQIHVYTETSARTAHMHVNSQH